MIMVCQRPSSLCRLVRYCRRRGFTLVELLVVIAVVAVLAAILLPVLARAKMRSQGIYCLNNTKQLTLAWIMYADDNRGRLAYNLGGAALNRGVAPDNYLNWVNNRLTWELDSDNTNILTILEAGLGAYANRLVSTYQCPADRVLSDIQQRAGWKGRIRSYSMNAMVGDAGELSASGQNVNNPDYVQFFSLASIPKPSEIFVFLDEHPDSINDGYFVNKAYYPDWLDLPASYHNRAASFSWADGHSEPHRWLYQSTMPPSRPDSAHLPIDIPKGERGDFYWVIRHMSVEHDEAKQ